MIPILFIITYIIRFNLTCQMETMLLPKYETHNFRNSTHTHEIRGFERDKNHRDRHMDTLIHIAMKVYVRLEPLNCCNV